jgi:hypothetical protein
MARSGRLSRLDRLELAQSKEPTPPTPLKEASLVVILREAEDLLLHLPLPVLKSVSSVTIRGRPSF